MHAECRQDPNRISKGGRPDPQFGSPCAGDVEYHRHRDVVNMLKLVHSLWIFARMRRVSSSEGHIMCVVLEGHIMSA
jgi:hypothetical protein